MLETKHNICWLQQMIIKHTHMRSMNTCLLTILFAVLIVVCAANGIVGFRRAVGKMRPGAFKQRRNTGCFAASPPKLAPATPPQWHNRTLLNLTQFSRSQCAAVKESCVRRNFVHIWYAIKRGRRCSINFSQYSAESRPEPHIPGAK